MQKNINLAFDIIQYCDEPRLLDFANSSKLTALHLSVATDQPQITRCLIAYGASLRVKDREGKMCCMLMNIKLIFLEQFSFEFEFLKN